jgi:hypothetical protein
MPLLRGKQFHFPSRPVCPVCRRRKVFEPHSFAVLSAGAFLKTRGGFAGPDDRMEAFLDVTWHGAHDGGSGEHPEIGVRMPVAEDVAGGQFELYFCSTRCLRRFFKDLVDELEHRMQRASKRELAHARKTVRQRARAVRP